MEINQEIWGQVMTTYPTTDREKTCQLHARKMEFKRQLLYKKLMDERQGKKAVYSASPQGKRQI